MCSVHKVVFDYEGTPVDLECAHVNPAGEQYHGCPASELIGKRVTQIFLVFKGESFELQKKYIDIALSGKSVSFNHISNTKIGGIPSLPSALRNGMSQ